MLVPDINLQAVSLSISSIDFTLLQSVRQQLLANEITASLWSNLHTINYSAAISYFKAIF